MPLELLYTVNFLLFIGNFLFTLYNIFKLRNKEYLILSYIFAFILYGTMFVLGAWNYDVGAILSLNLLLNALMIIHSLIFFAGLFLLFTPK